MKKKIVKIGIFVSLVALATMGTKIANNDKVSSIRTMLANMEALANPEEGNSGACCKNGYKKYNATSNIPTQRKEYFKDCWCNPKEGFDPVACEC